MLSTRYVDGSPVWLDLSSPDLAVARKFYTGLFGWTFDQGGPEVGGYGVFQLSGRTAAGAMTVTPDQAPPAWNLYFQTSDIDASAQAVEREGGTVAMAPVDVMDMGRMATFLDSSGAAFSGWQPGTNKGLGAAGETGALCWAELYTPDTGGALAFYGGVWGWGSSEMTFENGAYVMVHPEGGTPDDMFAGMVPVDEDPAGARGGPYWLPYFAVADCDATAGRATELGGTVRVPPTDIPDVGRVAGFADPHGARFAVLQPQDR